MKCKCKQCGKDFELSDSEILFYERKGLNRPKRCKECRQANKRDENPIEVDSVKNAVKYCTVPEKRQYEPEKYEPKKYEQIKINVVNEKTSSDKKLFVYIGIAALVITAIILALLWRGGARPQDNQIETADISENVNLVDNELIISQSEEVITEAQTENDIEPEIEADIELDAEADIELDAEVDIEIDPEDAPETSEATESEPVATPEVTPAIVVIPPAEEPVIDQPVLPSYVFRNESLLSQHYEKHGIEMGFSSAQEYQAAASAVINNPAALHKTEAEDGDGVYYIEATNEFVILSTDGYIRTYFLPDAGKDYYDRQ